MGRRQRRCPLLDVLVVAPSLAFFALGEEVGDALRKGLGLGRGRRLCRPLGAAKATTSGGRLSSMHPQD